jgi:transposase
MSKKYMMAAIDVHKRVLMVVVGDGAQEGEVPFHRRKFGARDGDLKVLSAWLQDLGVQAVVMESTAQYWKPLWQALEGRFHLDLAQAQSNRGRKGRKSDFRDTERLFRRYNADELVLSFVPEPQQRLWRTLSRTRVRWTRDKTRVQNRLEALLEEMRIKLSSVVSDLLGVSARRMLGAIAEGEQDLEKLAQMADPNLQASKAVLCDALQGVKQLNPRYRVVLKQFLEQVEMYERQGRDLEQALADELKPYGDQVARLSEVPGLGPDSAQQIIAEVGPTAEKFPTAGELSSWVGVCPGENKSAEKSTSESSAKGNEAMRRILDQAANAAVKAKGTVFEARYRRIKGRDPKKHGKAVWAVAHHICRVIWKILHDGVRYEEYGNRTDPQAVKRRAVRLLRELRSLGYQVSSKLVTPEVRATNTC